MTAKRQAVLYYARKRRRSLAGTVRLHKTAVAAIGETRQSPFTNSQLSRSVTFKTRVDLSSPPGEIFSLGSSIVVSRTTSQIIVTWRGNTIATVDQPMVNARWDLILSLVPGVAQSRLWNQEGELARNQLAGPPFTTLADLADDLSASSGLLENLSVYACQIPRHYHPIPEGVLQQVVDQLLFNLTAATSYPGLSSPVWNRSPAAALFSVQLIYTGLHRATERLPNEQQRT